MLLDLLRTGVYGIFSLTGEAHPEGKNPYNTLIMITDQGEINLVYRKARQYSSSHPQSSVPVTLRGKEGVQGGPIELPRAQGTVYVHVWHLQHMMCLVLFGAHGNFCA